MSSTGFVARASGSKRASGIQVIPLADIDERKLAAWRELADRAAEPNPFWDPDFVLPAARGLGQEHEVAILCEVNGSDWSAALPIRRYRPWHRLPVPCVASWLHPYCLLGTPLLAPERESRGLGSLVAGMRSVSRFALIAGMDWISADGLGGEAPGTASNHGGIEISRFSRAVLRRRPQPDYLEGRVRGKHRREFRRLARGLAEDLGGPLEIVDRSDEADAIDAFLDLEASGWKGQAQTALSSSPGHARFFREAAEAFAARGSFELLFLEGGGQTAAARCSFLSGGASFCFKLAFDERLGRFSPGRELELRVIDRFHDEGKLEWMDSCAQPSSETFSRLWPDRRELVTTAYPAPGPIGAGIRMAAKAAKRYRDTRAARERTSGGR